MSTHLDSKGNRHASAADAAQANSTYNTEKYAKQQRAASVVTAAATTATALYAKRQAEETERIAQFAELQSNEAKRQTAIIEEKAEFERLLSFLEGESDENKWGVIYPHIAEHINESAIQFTSHKLYRLISSNAAHNDIKSALETLCEAKQDMKDLKHGWSVHAKDITTITNGGIKVTNIKNIEIPFHYKILSSKRANGIVCGIIFIIFLTLAINGRANTLNPSFLRVLFAATLATCFFGWIPTLISFLFRKRIQKIEFHKAEIAEFHSAYEKCRAEFNDACDILEKCDLRNQTDWHLTENECFTRIKLATNEWQTKVPPRCRVQLTEEITKFEIRDLIDRTHSFIQEHFVATLMMQHEKQTKS